MSSPDARGNGPVMQLLATGLQLWIRQQCQAIGSLDIQLEGSALQLLRGRLTGVQLLARRVVYRDLHLELVELRSGPIQVHIGNLLKGHPLQLEHAFQIQGQVSFTPDGLTRSLSDPIWRSLGDNLSEELLGIAPLVELRMHRDSLVFTARGLGARDLVELETSVAAVEGSVEIRSRAGNVSSRLPMDPGITIEDARLEGGMLQLLGIARVSV
ncbi:DUF2993 domain-containing protein [Cyanobium sp. ATX 6E8]|uniref:LmeA family phospholipid-binding protein n=1 Tax=Cyanobium sp. ATX 6E8 TaxID=2823701 RepID=UPI0020CFC1C9|nr:DUF2993 domain-containing protein [Cyanobium sp. ATX 6E8]